MKWTLVFVSRLFQQRDRAHPPRRSSVPLADTILHQRQRAEEEDARTETQRLWRLACTKDQIDNGNHVENGGLPVAICVTSVAWRRANSRRRADKNGRRRGWKWGWRRRGRRGRRRGRRRRRRRRWWRCASWWAGYLRCAVRWSAPKERVFSCNSADNDQRELAFEKNKYRTQCSA